MAGEWLTKRDFDHETVVAFCDFFDLVRGLDIYEKWEDADLAEIKHALDKWIAAKENEDDQRRAGGDQG